MPCWFPVKGLEHHVQLLVGFPCMPFVFSQMTFSHMHFNPNLIRILPRGAGCERRCLYFWTLRSLRGLLGPKTVPWYWKIQQLWGYGFFSLVPACSSFSLHNILIFMCVICVVAQCGQPLPQVCTSPLALRSLTSSRLANKCEMTNEIFIFMYKIIRTPFRIPVHVLPSQRLRDVSY